MPENYFPPLYNALQSGTKKKNIKWNVFFQMHFKHFCADHSAERTSQTPLKMRLMAAAEKRSMKTPAAAVLNERENIFTLLPTGDGRSLAAVCRRIAGSTGSLRLVSLALKDVIGLLGRVKKH